MTVLNRMFGRPEPVDKFTKEQLDELELLVIAAIGESLHATYQFGWYLERIRLRKEGLVWLKKREGVQR